MEQEAKKPSMREAGEKVDNKNPKEQEEIVPDETLDPLDFSNRVSFLLRAFP